MIVRNRTGLSASVLAFSTILTLGSLATSAQEPPATKPANASAEKKAYDPSRRVPPFFGQVGLTPDQKEEVYKVRAKYQKKVEDLQKQLAQVQAEMLAECESVLNDTQKKLLIQRREASAKSKKEKTAKPAATEKTVEKTGA